MHHDYHHKQQYPYPNQQKINMKRSNKPITLSAKRTSLNPTQLYAPTKVEWQPSSNEKQPSNKALYQTMKSQLSNIKQDFDKLIHREITLHKKREGREQEPLGERGEQNARSRSKGKGRSEERPQHKYYYATSAKNPAEIKYVQEQVNQPTTTAFEAVTIPTVRTASQPQPSSQIEGLRQQLRQTEIAGESARREFSELKSRTEWMNSQIDILNQQLQRQRDKEQNWCSHQRELVNQLQNLQSERGQWQARVQQLMSHNQQLFNINQQLGQQNQRLSQLSTGQGSRRQSDDGNNSRINVEMQGQLRRKTAELDQLRVREGRLEQQLIRMKQEMSQIEQKALEKKPNTHQYQHPQELLNQIEDLKDANIHLAKQVQIERQIHESLTKQYSEKLQKQGIEELSSQLESKMASLVEENGRLKSTINKQEAQMEAMRLTADSQREEIRLYEEREVHIKRNPSSNEREIGELRGQCQQMREQNQQLQVQIEQLQQEIEGLKQKGESEGKGLQCGVGDLMSMLHGQLEEIESLRATIRQKDSQIRENTNNKAVESKQSAVSRMRWMKEWLWRVMVQKANRIEGEEDIEYYMRQIQEQREVLGLKA